MDMMRFKVAARPLALAAGLLAGMTFCVGAQAQVMEYSHSGKVDRGGRYLYRALQPDGTLKEIPHRGSEDWSVARHWNETMLECIRHDKSRPTVHARNLYHVSAAMWDAWAAYTTVPDQVFHHERVVSGNLEADRDKAISFAAYRLLLHRFQNSVGAPTSIPLIEAKLGELGYNPADNTPPAALGIRIANTIIAFGDTDGANEAGDYENQYYEPVNEPLIVELPGNPELSDPNHWQPLAIEFFIDQSGNPIPFGALNALSPEWGIVSPFSLHPEDANVYQRDGFDYWVYHDPGYPPFLGGPGEDYYRWGVEQVLMWSSHLDPTDNVVIDISPATFGNSDLPDVDEWADYYDRENGGDWSPGHPINPVTGLPYPPEIVPRGDYARILAEFWADGPDSETPPGHWFTILNYVNDHPDFEKRLMGEGPILPDLEWDVKAYLLMGGAMHDTAIACWGAKGWYDYIRPVSAIRWMCDRGQSSNPTMPSYNPLGIRLVPGYIELVTAQTTMPGARHEHLAGSEGKIAVLGWRGPDFIVDPDVDDAGVGWILGRDWWPYQRPSFVSPPFPGYYSGHSTYSRCAAHVMGAMTGSEFFPGGVGEFLCPQNEFLVFEDGPSINCTLQWARYIDASDQTSMSRIWGGIHPPADDLPGRHIGIEIHKDAVALARRYYSGQVSCPADFDGNRMLDFTDVLGFLTAFGTGDLLIDTAAPFRVLDFSDVLNFLIAFGAGCP